MDKLKIGLVGVFYPNFDALKLGIYEKSKKEMRILANHFNFKLVVIEKAINLKEKAEKAARQLQLSGIDFLLIQTSSFSQGDVILPLIKLNVPLGLWFLPEPSFEGHIPLNSFTGFNLAASIIHLKEPQSFKWFFGMATDFRFKQRLQITIYALDALRKLNHAKICLIGGIAPTFFNLNYDASSIYHRLGVQIEVQPLTNVFQRIDNYSESKIVEVTRAMIDRTTKVSVTSDWIRRTSQIYLALRDLVNEGNYSALAVRCWPEFQSELNGIAPCAAISWLNETGIPTSCEGDVIGALSMLSAYYVSHVPTTLTDMVALEEKHELVQLWHCGCTSPSWADEMGQALTYHPTLDRTNPPGSPKTGVSSDLVFAPGLVTIIRFSQEIDNLLLMSAEVMRGPTRGYAGTRGWLGNFRINNESLSITDLIETISYYGLVHHYPLARGNWSDIFHELTAWSGINILKKISHQNYLVSSSLLSKNLLNKKIKK